MKVGKNENSHSTQNLTREQLDYYHQKGIIPDWAYYSRIGETPTEELYS